MGGNKTNNGVESLNDVINNSVFDGDTSKNSLPLLLMGLTTEFLPRKISAFHHKVWIYLKQIIYLFIGC